MNGSAPEITMPPLLANEPDGRRARFQLFGSAVPVYLALMAGVLVATATVAWNLALAKSYRRLALALSLGIAATLAITFAFALMLNVGWDRSVAYFGTSLAELAVGAALYKIQHPIVRGHMLLGGKSIPTALLVLPVFAAAFLAPLVLFYLHHPLLLLADYL
jgi:hypothetical protein